MAHNEQSVADIFNDYMRERCLEEGEEFHAFALGGQDRDAADYLISHAQGFALIEFKHSEAATVTEGKKPRREKLCLLLQESSAMRKLHDTCHFIAWEDSSTGIIRCAPYRAEVCNQHVFSNCAKLKRARPMDLRRMDAETYCEQFLTPPPPRYADKDNFERYLAWLMKDASGSDKQTVELMARARHGCATVRFESVNAAYAWMQEKVGFSRRRRSAKP